MFYERLQEACKKNNIKLTPLLKELNLSTGAIARWKAGVIPNGKTIQMLSDRLGVSVSLLLGEDETEKEKAVQRTAREMEDLTEEERKKVLEYIDFVKSKRDGDNKQ